MPSVAYASSLVKQIGSPIMAGEREKTIIPRILRRIMALGTVEAPSWSWNRVHDIFTERKNIRVHDDEIRDLERASKQRERAAVDEWVKKAASDELRELTTRLNRLEAALLVKDQEFFGPQVDCLREALRSAGRSDRAVDRGLKHSPD